MPPGYPPFLHCHLFFYFFSIFCIQYISVSLPATYTHSRQHIPFGFCLLPELYAFIIFSFEVFSFFRKSPRFLPASAGRILPASFLSIHKSEPRVPDCRPYASRTFFFQSILSLSPAITLSSGVSRPYLTRSILTNSQARISRSGLPAITSDISYLLNIQKPATHIRLCRPALLQSPTLPQTSSAISRCLRSTSFPRHFAAAFYSSNIPFFLFFLSSTLFLFLFFSFFFPLFLFFLLFIIFSLHFLFSRLFLSSFLFSFSYPLFLFSFFYFYHHACFSCAPSQRLKNRT